MMIRVIVAALIVFCALPCPAQQDKAGLPIKNISNAGLKELVDVALQNNPSVASRKALVAATAARVGMAKAMTRPQVSTSTFGTLNNMPMVFPGPDAVEPRNFSLTADKPRLDQNVMAMFPVYTGGSLSGRINSAQSLKDAASCDAVTVELDTALAVKNAYYQTLLVQKYVDAYQKRVDEATERARIAESAYAEGRIARYDLLRNQTDLAEARQQLNNSQRDVEMALIDLKNMMGISQSSQLTVTQELAAPAAPPSLDELQATAIKQRPEIQAARARARSAQSNIAVAKSAYKPQVYGTAMADLSVMKGDSVNGATDTGYLVGIAAALPIFDGGLRKSSVDEANAMLLQMQADERDALLAVSKEVAASYTQFTAASKNADLAQPAIAQSEEDYRVIRMRYEAGKATNVEVLDSLAALTRARTMYAEALYQQNVAREQITRAIGER